MNPVDHPYGGGEGKKSKKSISMSPWGALVKGKKNSNLIIMRSRWKGLYVHVILYKFIKSQQIDFGPAWLSQKINLRSSTLIDSLKKKALFIHDGLILVRIKVFSTELKNLKLGQFTYNRKLPRHALYDRARIDANKLILIQRGVIKKAKRRRAIWKKFNIIK